ncbi:shikimate kinase [Flavobacterium sp. ST-75]|uniref:Shikimate kinase n=1 Tax=Flavobacterium rhizophilum TaxID=3163296 RepID=A0ABW8YGI0_9FLAO
MKKILLSGYMASGKSTIAQLLSKASGIPYRDLDDIIAENAQKSVSDIFSEDGEIKFRKMEHEALKAVLSDDKGLILALGGGTPCYANNHEFLKCDDVMSIYLKASIPELLKRLRADGKERPLFDKQPPEEQEEFVAKHLFDRSYFYHQSKHVIMTDGKTTENIVNEIMSLF